MSHVLSRGMLPHMRLVRAATILLAVALSLCASRLSAQEKESPPEKPVAEQPTRDPLIMSDSVVIVSTLVGLGNDPTDSVALCHPRFNILWPEMQSLPPEEPLPTPTTAPILLADRLAGVRDNRGIPSAYDDGVAFGADEHQAFGYVLYEASRTPVSAFKKSARPDLTWVHLFTEPAKYRGEVVTLEGRLRRLLKFDPPADAAQAGVKAQYEGWLFTEGVGSYPTCIIFTELPAGIEPGMKTDYRVRFTGYFFKRYRYKAADTIKENQYREVPLLIGRSVELLSASAPVAQATWTDYVILAFIGTTTAAVFVIIILGIWLRRGDRRVKAQLESRLKPAFVDPGAQSEVPLAMPVPRPEDVPPSQGHGVNRLGGPPPG